MNRNGKTKSQINIYKTLYSNKNNGFGEGNNVGVRHAKGKYVFFLNPDTTISPNTIESLHLYLENNKTVGIAAPLLMHENKQLFDQLHKKSY